MDRRDFIGAAASIAATAIVARVPQPHGQPDNFDPLPFTECERLGILDCRVNMPRDDRRSPYLDGVKVPHGIRICIRDGWVDEYVPHPEHGGPYCTASGNSAIRRRFGAVTLV